MVFDDEKIEELIAQCRLEEASAALALLRADGRRRAALYAIAGDDRGLARVADPALLACRSRTELAAHYARSNAAPDAYDDCAVAAILAWSSDEEGTFASLRAARDRAIGDRSFHFAVAACERLAHHALLFGDVDLARDTLAEAIALAQAHDLPAWLLRSLAAAARISLDAGHLEAAEKFVARGRAVAGSSDELALFAATGAQICIELGDDSALCEWTREAGTALHSRLPDVANSATIAVLIGGGAAPNAVATTALQRAMLQNDNVANAPELFSFGARYAPLADARRAVEALAATVAPTRRYLLAHHLLARAHASSRLGERSSSIDSAGDAARAFSAMGLRRWTNEAMGLLVSHERAPDRRSRGRPSGYALTEREEQVAQLIRRGARNREVANALQISEHTVERHVSSILGRLGLRSRWQIGAPPADSES
jgi:DNA-binding CsgD family transcriptional regulator